MRVNAPLFRISLRRGQPLTLADGLGTSITARRGTVWITQDDDPRDVVLSSGECFTLDHPELAIVQSFDAAEILVRPPAGHDHAVLAPSAPSAPSASAASRLMQAFSRGALAMRSRMDWAGADRPRPD